MATVHLHLQNVPPEAGARDIQRFFSNIDIPDGGVQIVGGPEGNAFVTFSNNEDLLKATTYDKSYLMGRQLLMNLVNGEEIEQIVDNMKHELVARIRPMEIQHSQQASQSRELPLGMAAPQEDTPPMEFPSYSNDRQWQKHHLDTVPPQLPGYSSSSMYAGGEPKRMRPSSQELDEGRYYNSTSTFSADSGSKNLQMELEIECRRGQEMKDQLNRYKEEIDRLKRGIIEEDDVTVPRTNPVVGEAQTPQMTDSRAGSLRWQSQLQAEQSRHQQSAAYGRQADGNNHEVANYPGWTPYYGDQRYSGQKEGNNQGGARYHGPSPYGNQSYGGHNEGYNRKDPMYPGPSPNYKDQQPPGMNPEFYPGRMLTKKERKRQNKASNEGHNCENPKYPGPSPNYIDQQQPGMNLENPGKNLSKNQRKKLNKARRLGLGGSKQELQPPVDVKRGLVDLTSSHPGYVKMSNVDHTVTATEVRRFFEGHQISPGGLKMKKNDDENTFTVYIKFALLEDAHNCYKKNKSQLNGTEVAIEAISASDFDAQEGTNKVQEEFPPQSTETPTQKPATSKAPKKPKISGGQKVTSPPVNKVKKVSSPYSGSIKQALYFTSLRALPEDATASSVWKRFGGSTGRSVGVLLLDKKGNAAGKEAFVAYENYYDRNSEIPLHEGARDWIDRGVYIRFASASPESKMYKTTPMGEDVEISDDEKAMLEKKFFVGSSRTRLTNVSEKDRETEQPILNEISRSLFDIRTTEVNEQVNIPDSGENKSVTCASEPCYLRLDCLPPDINAREVWDWFGAATGPCPRVTLTKLYGKEAPKTKVAYVAFRDHNSCNAETYKYNRSKIMTEKEAFDDMAKTGSIVIEATDEVLKRPEGVSCPFSGSIKQALYFTYLRSLPEDATASTVWEKFGSSNGCSVGVLLLEKGLGAVKEAYVAYENYYDRNCEMVRHKGASDWMDRGVYTRLANASPESKIYKTTPTGEDVEISDNEKAMFGQKFLLSSSRTHSTNMTQKERETEQPFLNEISRSLFDITSTEVYQQVNMPDSGENKAATWASDPCYLRLDCLPPEITAHEVWDWFDAATGPCLRVTLTRVYGKEALKTKVAYIAFRDHNSCNAETYKYDQSKTMTEKEVFDEIADTGIRVIESTEEVVTKEEMQVDLKAEASVHILKLKDIGRKLSSSKLWTGWFGGKKGLAQAVTVMDDGRTRTAFVVFRDPVKCKAEKVKYQFSEVISETEMLKLFACCPPNGPPDQSIITSNAMGDRIMAKRERADLKARFYSTKKPTDAKEKEKVKTSEHTSVTSKEKQIDSKVKCDSEERQANVNSEKKGKISNYMSEANIESTTSKPEENQANVSDDEKGKAPDGTSTGSTAPKPEESTDMEDVTEPKSIADTELTPCIGGTQTKFFVQIPGVTPRITSSKIWSWFGGPEGSVPRITVVPKVGNLLGQAYVEFTEAAGCNAALSHYQSSKVLTEQEVLCILAAHACRSSKDIFQSSVLGVDRAMTVEERELIIKKAYPMENTDRKEAEEKPETISDEEGGDTSTHTSGRKKGSESRDPEPTGDTEAPEDDVPM